MGLLSRLVACLTTTLRLKSSRPGDGEDAPDDSSNDLFFDLRTLQVATNFFSELNQLGHGGFGPVYKGLIPNGQEVAVKKLSLTSRQGLREFTNEVKLLLRIQHKNLVTLLGCCAEGPEMMLVYEYLPNKSLDYFLFGDNSSKSSPLNWPTRFRIVTGVARGLLYLHEEAPVRIIHRDIKASNILLDEQLNPKISDFGLARLFPGEDTHVNTFRISGTHGYMAPEYAMHGYLSVKTDVFSYGVLVLEIVSGRKNTDRRYGIEKADLLSYAWNLFQQRKTLELVDPSLEKYNRDEVAMCIQLGLLCCQQSIPDRPDMNSVHLMLSSDSFTLPKPGRPGIQGRGASWTTTSTSALTADTNASTLTGVTKASGGNSSVEDYSRNSISVSSIDEEIKRSRPITTETKMKPNWELRNCCNHEQVVFLVTVSVCTVVILALWRTVLLRPFKLVTVFLHEASHAVACKLTCGHVEGIQVHADEGGTPQTRGGVYWLILPAGYLGSSFWGMVLILASTNLLTARIAAGCFIAALLVVLLVAKNWTLRGLCIGFVVFIGVIWVLQETTKARILRYVILFIGVMNSLFSVYDIYDDLISRRVHSSDAEKFAEGIDLFFVSVRSNVPWSCYIVLTSEEKEVLLILVYPRAAA
ncbi:hypothetical protein Tsubulata_039411 [Turnera subulata]|uniref:Protein kinase domain-containing protein n=1 Tax=Turnera subulata TaxID=218843 RepID=A0A9Q0JIR8_9ROSI|nr:hypothetical protein Tsubulata_039411 [Turnera subulata]